MTTTPAAATFAKTTQGIEDHLLNTVGVAPALASPNDLMQAVARVAREQLSRRWVATQAVDRADKARRVYYLSMEFLIGRTLGNALAALDLRDGAAAGAGACMRQRLEDVGRAGGRRRAGQRRPGPARGLLPRLDGHARPALVRLRHPLRVRHVRAGDRRRPPGRVPRPVARRRHAVGVSARRRAATRCASAAGSSTAAAQPRWRRRPRSAPRPTTWWCRATARPRSARCGCGRRWRRRTSTCMPSTAATTRAPPR